MAQAPLQSPFYYYNPESDKARQHHQHMNQQQQQQQQQHQQQQQQQLQGHFYHMQPQQNDYFSQPYTQSRPQSAHAAPQMLYHPQPHYISQAMLTPVASPSRDMHQRPTILVQHQQEMTCMMPMDNDYKFGPATPTLSSTSSMSSDSPQQSYPMLPTPSGDMYLTSFDGLKHSCDEEMFSDVLNGGDWAKSGSPPMTPGTHRH